MIPKDLKCPECDVPVIAIRSVTPGETPSIGDGFLCSCGAMLEFTETGLQTIPSDELRKQSPEELADINFARRVLNIPNNGT